MLSFEIPLIIQTILIVIGMILTFYVTFRTSIKKVDFSQFFLNESTGFVSHTKIWGSVAYFVTTCMFIYLNLVHAQDIAALEFLWMIYLSIVASNAVASKLIAARYNNTKQG